MNKKNILLTAICIVIAVMATTISFAAAWVFIDADTQVTLESGSWASNSENIIFEEIIVENVVVGYKAVGLTDAYEGHSVDIPSEYKTLPVTMIGAKFSQNVKIELMSLTIPSSVVTIEENAITNMDNLNSVKFIGDGLVTLSKNVFRGCNSLSVIVLPSSLRNIGEGVLSNCANLKTITVKALSADINSGRAPIDFGLKNDGELPTITYGKIDKEAV